MGFSPASLPFVDASHFRPSHVNKNYLDTSHDLVPFHTQVILTLHPRLFIRTITLSTSSSAPESRGSSLSLRYIVPEVLRSYLSPWFPPKCKFTLLPRTRSQHSFCQIFRSGSVLWHICPIEKFNIIVTWYCTDTDIVGLIAPTLPSSWFRCKRPKRSLGTILMFSLELVWLMWFRTCSF